MNYDIIITEISKVLFGAIIGTIFTSFYKDFKDKKNEQKHLFLRMITAKSYIQIPQMLINDLNTIEILFRRNKKVLDSYHLYYQELSVSKEQIDYERQRGLYLDLLREIGNIVGYKHLDNKTLISRYIPGAAVDEHLLSQEFRQELLKYLKNGNLYYEALVNHTINTPPSEVI